MASRKIIIGHILIPLFFLFASTECEVKSLNVSTHCIKEERMALLNIKKDLSDTSNCLSSWVGEDCCNWKGIECDNKTGHVLKFELKPYICNKTASIFSLFGGEINPSLADLKHLSHLDLSYNYFNGISIPEFIGSLNMLKYLDLSNAKFTGMVPTDLANLSNLHHLDISSSDSSVWVRDLSWLSALSSLQYLGMDYVNVTNSSHELFRAVKKMPSLLELHLASCGISSLPPSSPFLNITSLSVLDLSGNPLNTSMPSWLLNMSTLTELNLYASSLIGPIPSMSGRWNLCQIQHLVLGLNHLTGDINELIEGLSCSNQSLVFLDLSNNQLTGKLPHLLGEFTSLYYLDLSTNPVNSHTISGPIPTSIGNLSNLVYLNVDSNMLNGAIPESIGKLTNLHSLHLRENYWEGTLTNIHFHNLTNLAYLSVSSKQNLLALKLTNDWVPPFKNLFHLEISGCDVGPTFPIWLRDLNSLNDIMSRPKNTYRDRRTN